MSNSSPEYWSLANLDGTNEISLHQWGWAVTTVGGGRYDVPPKRGSDITVAYRPGQVFRRKVVDARQITLSMFMVGWDPATGNAPRDQLTQWNDNWEALRRAVFRHSQLNDQRVRLIRRCFLTNETFPTTRGGQDICIQGDPGVPAAGKQLHWSFANAEMTGNMQPSMTGRFRSEFELDFTLGDPYFYGSNVTATLTPLGYFGGGPVYVWNDGYEVAASGYIQVDLYGPLVNPVLTNLSTNPDSWVKYNAIIPPGQNIRLMINKFTCEQIVSGSSTNINKIAAISNYGARFWLNLIPGANKLQLTDSSSGSYAGTCVVNFRPPYI